MSDNKPKKQLDEAAVEKQFEEWLSGGGMSEGVEQSPVWQARANTANYIEHQAQLENQQAVPQWDRANAFHSEKSHWWQWQGLPAMSMVFSIFAVALVLFKVELIVKPEGILFSFNQNSQQQTEKVLSDVVDQRLKAFAMEQQLILSDYAAELSTKQQSSNLELASYILSTSREERKADMVDFIQYINERSNEDRLQQNIKFRQFEQALHYQSTYLSNDSGAGNSRPTVKPTNLIYEE